MRAPLVLFALLVACRSADAPPPPPRPALVVPPPPSASVDAAVALTPDAGPAEPLDAPSTVAFLSDGTLLVVGRRTLVARGPDGTTHRRRIAEDAIVEYSDAVRGATITTKDIVELVATPSLATLHHGAGEPVANTRSALVVDDGSAVVLQHGDAILRLALPTERRGARVTSVTSLAKGARINVAYETDTDGFAGTLFDATTGAATGPGFAERSSSYLPLSGVADAVAFVVKGDRLARVELLTAKVSRQAAMGCGKDRDLGNPTPNARGDLVVVTCMDEGLVLDGATLRILRRIPRILPGCDNGLILGGVVLADEHTLLLSGCGGQAKIDLSNGRYLCGDSSGIVGAPYEGFRRPIGPMGSARIAPVAPTGRDRLPRCSRAEQANTIGRSGRFRIVYGEQVTLESDGARPIVLDSSTIPSVAPDEKSFAYARGAIVVVRALPGGEPIAEVRMDR